MLNVDQRNTLIKLQLILQVNATIFNNIKVHYVSAKAVNMFIYVDIIGCIINSTVGMQSLGVNLTMKMYLNELNASGWID